MADVVFILHLILSLPCKRMTTWQSKTFLPERLQTTNSRGAFRLQGSGNQCRRYYLNFAQVGGFHMQDSGGNKGE